MKALRWDPEKSAWLKERRGVSFEEMIQAPLLSITENYARPDQKLLLFDYEGYVWAIPCIETENEFFLKTMYPSRRYQKLWKNGRLNLS